MRNGQEEPHLPIIILSLFSLSRSSLVLLRIRLRSCLVRNMGNGCSGFSPPRAFTATGCCMYLHNLRFVRIQSMYQHGNVIMRKIWNTSQVKTSGEKVHILVCFHIRHRQLIEIMLVSGSSRAFTSLSESFRQERLIPPLHTRNNTSIGWPHNQGLAGQRF